MKITGCMLKLNEVTSNDTMYTEESFANIGDISLPLLKEFNSSALVGNVTKIWLEGNNLMFEGTIDSSKEAETLLYTSAAPAVLATNMVLVEAGVKVLRPVGCFIQCVSLVTAHSQPSCTFTRS